MIHTVFLCFALVLVVQAVDMKEKVKQIQEDYEVIKSKCAKKLDTTVDKINQFEEKFQEVKSRNDMCVLECLFTESGLMKDGRFSREGADEISEFFYEDDAENLNLAKEITRVCEKQVEAAKIEDGCEVAAEVFNCLKMETKRRLHKQYEDY